MKRLVFVLAALVLSASAASAACVLKLEKMPDDAKCMGLVGYANGARVGFYRVQGAAVGFGGSCAAGVLRGRKAGSNRVSVNGQTRTLSDDCRSSTPN